MEEDNNPNEGISVFYKDTQLTGITCVDIIWDRGQTRAAPWGQVCAVALLLAKDEQEPPSAEQPDSGRRGGEEQGALFAKLAS